MKLNAPLFLIGTCTFLLGLLYMSWFGFIEVEAEIYNAGMVYRSLGILALLLGFFFNQLMRRSKVWSVIALVLATLIAVLHIPPLFLWLSNAPVTDSPTSFPNPQTALYPILHFFSLLCYVWFLRASKPRQTLREQKVPLALIALLPIGILATWFMAIELQSNQPQIFSVPSDQQMTIPWENSEQELRTALPASPQSIQLVAEAFPEFSDFSESSSFAGQSIESFQIGSDEYITFTVHGSGVPIVKATCFRISQDLLVYKVGEFPQMTDSYAGYQAIDPTTCNGVK